MRRMLVHREDRVCDLIARRMGEQERLFVVSMVRRRGGVEGEARPVAAKYIVQRTD